MTTSKIYLLGFMGSGKSFVGQQLATVLDIEFVDLDDYIEQAENQTIASIFEQKGEAYFRNTESQMLKKTANFNNTIIATGGGTPCFFDNIDWMNEHGKTVFLNPTVDILFERLKSETTKRPLLAQKSEKELRQFISQKLESRLKYYEKAQQIINITTFDQDVIKLMC